MEIQRSQTLSFSTRLHEFFSCAWLEFNAFQKLRPLNLLQTKIIIIISNPFRVKVSDRNESDCAELTICRRKFLHSFDKIDCISGKLNMCYCCLIQDWSGCYTPCVTLLLHILQVVIYFDQGESFLLEFQFIYFSNYQA